MTDLEESIRRLVREEAAKKEHDEITRRARVKLMGGLPHPQHPEVERLTQQLQALRRVAEAKLTPLLKFRLRHPDYDSDAPGLIYAIALIPEVTPFRVKVGYTERGVGERLRKYLTPCPTAVVMGAWSAHRSDEQRVHDALPERLGDSEVFLCNDVEPLLDAIDRVLGAAR
jgi:hypothetical protein